MRQLRRIMALLVSILIMESFVINEPILDVIGADPPPPSNRFGNWVEPETFNITVTENTNTITVSTNNTFEWEFFKDTAGYNKIWHNGSVLVHDERWYLEYQHQSGSYKVRGIPYNVTYEQLAPNHVIVTRKYTDSISTDFNVTFDFLNNNRVKITLIGDIGQTDTYRVRWDATGINTEHMEHNSSANHTKIWTGTDEGMVFDYEDVYQGFGNITIVETEHQANNHKLHYYFNVGELEVGGFELDPTFGYETYTSSLYITYQNTEYYKGFWDETVSAGTVDNMSVYFATVYESTRNFQCALYEYTDYSSSYAGALVGTTESKDVLTSQDTTWITFDFSEPKPTIESGTKYYLVCRATDNIYGSVKTGITSLSGYDIYYSGSSPHAFDDPLTGESTMGYIPTIYASYTEGGANTAPTVDYKTPVNGTTGVTISGGVKCYAYTNDTDGDTLDITWATNEGGSWVNKYTNSSEAANGIESYTFADFDTASTKYYWKVYVNDGTVNISEVYHFTTADFIWIDITNATWDLGNIVMSSSTWTNETGKTFIADKDNCSVATDLKLQITNDGADWTAATSGNAPGTNTYRINASTDSWVTQFQIVTASATTISTNIAFNQNETFDLRFDAPTSSSTGDQQSITVTATLVKH